MLELTVSSADGLIAALETRDRSTLAHCEEVVDLACEIGRELDLPLEELELAARLHDVGKLGIPDAILGKRGPLSETEWLLMRRHPDLGAAMLRAIPGLEEVAALVRFHHERWDGRGYPEGLAEEEIPLASRIICVCDAWNAMRSDRPYRAALTRAGALAELHAGAGRQFDPLVVRLLLAIV